MIFDLNLRYLNAVELSSWRQHMTKRFVIVLLALLAVFAISCGQNPAEEQTEEAYHSDEAESTQETTESASEESVAIPADFAFSLADQPSLEKTKELDDLSEDQQKAIYLEYKKAMEEAADRVYSSNLSSDQMFEAINNMDDKVKYEIAKKHGLTIAQIDQLNVFGLRFKWEE
jgi:hypothetical protein